MPTWQIQGDKIYANQTQFNVAGNLTQIKFVKGSNQTGSIKACVYNENFELVGESASLGLGSTGLFAVETIPINLLSTVSIAPGEIYYLGIKFPGTATGMLRNFDGAVGTRLNTPNLWAVNFPEDIITEPSLVIEDGLYAIWGVVENCVRPGCMNDTACNYDPEADEDDGSCTYPGCTNPDADNYDPLAICDDGNCTVTGCTERGAINYLPGVTTPVMCDFSNLSYEQRRDLDFNDIVDSGDLLLFLNDYYGSSPPWGALCDANDNGSVDTGDLNGFLSSFGAIVPTNPNPN